MTKVRSAEEFLETDYLCALRGRIPNRHQCRVKIPVGIINAFQGMTAGETTGLAAVAGGISEALVATAMGLFVAVPAVWMYNYFSTKVESFVVEMNNSSSELIDFFLKRGASE